MPHTYGCIAPTARSVTPACRRASHPTSPLPASPPRGATTPAPAPPPSAFPVSPSSIAATMSPPLKSSASITSPYARTANPLASRCCRAPSRCSVFSAPTNCRSALWSPPPPSSISGIKWDTFSPTPTPPHRPLWLPPAPAVGDGPTTAHRLTTCCPTRTKASASLFPPSTATRHCVLPASFPLPPKSKLFKATGTKHRYSAVPSRYPRPVRLNARGLLASGFIGGNTLVTSENLLFFDPLTQQFAIKI